MVTPLHYLHTPKDTPHHTMQTVFLPNRRNHMRIQPTKALTDLYLWFLLVLIHLHPLQVDHTVPPGLHQLHISRRRIR